MCSSDLVASSRRRHGTGIDRSGNACLCPGKAWWLTAALLGFAAASKPWAILAAPLLLGLPRHRRAPAVVVLLASAGVWWLPFVLADPATVSSLGGLHVVPDLGSVPHLLGLRGDASRWLRPVQFGGGIVAGIIAAQRRSYLAVPMVAVAWRVASNPSDFSYYGLGPLLVALGIDLVIRRPRTIAPCTLGTTFVFFALPLFAPASLCAAARLVWCVALVAAVVRPWPQRAGQARSRQLGASKPAVAPPTSVPLRRRAEIGRAHV